MKISNSRNLRKQLKVHVPTDYPWKVLDTLVEDLRDFLTDSEYQTVKVIIRKRDYEAYCVLSEEWGPQSTGLSDIKQTQMFARYQVASLLKKFQFPGNAKARRDTALEKFKAAEVTCADYNRDGYKTLRNLQEPEMLEAYTYARAFLQKLLGFQLPPREKLTFWSRHGPGANLDTSKRNTSTYHKYGEWPYSCTQGAVRHARLSIMDDERWLGALEDGYRERLGIAKHEILNQETFWSSVINVVPGNRITFVPKNSRTDRSIAIEPSLNLYLQLGVDGYIRRRLKRWDVDLDDQQKNQELARQGSKYWRTEDPFVTLDLAAASDTVSTELCYHLLPVPWYNYLMDLRCPEGVIDDEVVSYEKISSMGNGYTFALESAIFAAIVYGVQRAAQGHFVASEISVYGDDLIVRKSISDKVVHMLNLCGFTVNSEKSFFEGPFRESCGADWFNGTPVRPVFLTTMPSTVMELWCDYNRIRRVLNLRIMEFEPSVCALIAQWIPAVFAGITGPCSQDDDDSYMHSPTPISRKRRSMWEFKRLVITPKPLRGDSFLYRKLMHSLRPVAETAAAPWESKTWGGATVSASGTRFAITRSNSVIASYTPSFADNWQSEYADVMPSYCPSRGTNR